ncbi:hypothetical protein [Microbacterium sp. 1P06AB]|uniref:hypothetical protein n=1 Tax=Microbacterium sp. 1P06AB TaxID=3132289 RepID=UPI0039A5899F
MPNVGDLLLRGVGPLAFADGLHRVAQGPGWFEVWSVLIAGVAAALALASLLTQLREIYWSRPVIVLECSLRSTLKGWDAEILVTNVGERAVTITRSGWWYSYGTHSEDIHDANSSTKLPHRLEPHDAVAIRGRVRLKDAHWDWANGGLFRRPASSYDPPIGEWRDDGLPHHDQYAAPFVEIVRRPRNLLLTLPLALARGFSTKVFRSAWNPHTRLNAPKGHCRIWAKPVVIGSPFEGI